MKIRSRPRITALVLALVLFVCLAAEMYLAVIKYRESQAEPAQKDSVSDPIDDTQTRPPLIQIPDTSGSADPSGPAEPDRVLTAHHAFIYDVGSGELTMLRGQARDRIFPASITKLFSSYVILQHLETDLLVTAGDALDLVAEDASVAHIEKGNVLTVGMLMEGMLIPSGNDAACILAVEVGRKLGGIQLSAQEAMDVFVAEMNRQAQLLELTGTRFSNADGYHEELHYTTSEDLVKIGKLVLEHPLLSTLVAQDTKTVTFASGETQKWMASNFFVNSATEYYDPTCIGLKTGKTEAAGNCLLSAFQLGGRTVIIGVFGCPEMEDRFLDTQQVLKDFT